VDLLGALAEEDRDEEASHPATAIRAAGREAAALLLAWLHPPQGQGTESFGPLGAKWSEQQVGVSEGSASQQIDAIIRKMPGWHGERLGQLRALIRGADPSVRCQFGLDDRYGKPSAVVRAGPMAMPSVVPSFASCFTVSSADGKPSNNRRDYGRCQGKLTVALASG
jgi:hypothetical protein